jgi:mannose-6-phosphate isomerase class I
MASAQTFVERPRPLILRCGVQHYDWGQRGASAFIPALTGVRAENATPYAELWIGAHPVKPAEVELGGARLSLADLIAAAPLATLGPSCFERFGPRLPFLLKVLAAERMLSLQAHPNREQARVGFAREEAEGLSRNADTRSYRDDSHKPELLVALTDFFALSGFRPAAELVEVGARHPELADLLAPRDEPAAIESTFNAILSMEAERLDDVVSRIVRRLEAQDRERPLERSDHGFWLLRADRQFSRAGRRDPGVLALLLLNLVRLAPGEGLFLGAGELHSYLEGVGVEIMANSDNVLRGGLTSKHVDVAELRRVLTFRGGPARPIHPDDAGAYATPAEEFALMSVPLGPRSTWTAPVPRGPDVLLVVEGALRLSWSGEGMSLRRGDAIFIAPAIESYRLELAGESARVFRATTP